MGHWMVPGEKVRLNSLVLFVEVGTARLDDDECRGGRREVNRR